MASSNLYPPIVDTFMPTYIHNDSNYTASESALSSDIYNFEYEYYKRSGDTEPYTYISFGGTKPSEEEWYTLDNGTYNKTTDSYIKQDVDYYIATGDTETPYVLVTPKQIELYELKQEWKIYFSISSYNSLTEIQNVQVTAKYRDTSYSCLNETYYPYGIALKEIQVDDTKTGSDKYYITLDEHDVGVKDPFVYTKIQLRFTGVDAETVDLAVPQSDYEWFYNNSEYFSEWSTVSLFRYIYQPYINYNMKLDSNNDVQLVMANLHISGTFVVPGSTEYIQELDSSYSEYLKQYRVRLYSDSEYSTLIEDSDWIVTNNLDNPNLIDYHFKYAVTAGNRYYYTVEYITNNLYSDIDYKNFIVNNKKAKFIPVLFTGEKDIENGCIHFRVSKSLITNKDEYFTGKVIIRRSSSKDNFMVWEDLCIREFTDASSFDYEWTDFSIESGVWYDYAVQTVDSDEVRAAMIRFIEPVMLIFDDMFLADKNRQLKIKYNPQISSFKITHTDSKIDTLGSPYPFIRRNAATNYAQFSISGLIYSEMDEDGFFYSKEDAFGDSYDRYKNYNAVNGIDSQKDYVYEKMFRDEVIDFLGDDTLKLFRSPTEGNYIVRLMDVSLTPNQQLGRLVYTFTATAYQVKESTLDNYEEIGILPERSL